MPVPAPSEQCPNLTKIASTAGKVNWRSGKELYKTNELYMDIVEQVNLMMSTEGVVLRCDVNGRVLIKCKLSGNPTLRLGLNDKVAHQPTQLRMLCAGLLIDCMPFMWTTNPATVCNRMEDDTISCSLCVMSQQLVFSRVLASSRAPRRWRGQGE